MGGDSALVGRDALLDDLTEVCRRAPLVTITGPAGVGKTALLEVVAPRVAEDEGVVVRTAQLVAVDPAHDLERALLGRLNVPDAAELVTVLSARATLLALDNCEHLLPALRPLLARLCDAVPDLRVLATSTAPLDVDGEHLVVVPPLDEPDAIQLLRLIADERGADLTDVDDSVLADVIRLVDGLPLGVELAAGCLRTLPVEALVASLAEPGGLAALDGPTANRGLASVLTRSVDRLGTDPREALCQIAFLGGAFTAEIAAGALGWTTVATLQLLQELVDDSLLLREPHGNTGHFRFLHVIRSHLRDRCERVVVTDAQARFVSRAAEVADELERALLGPLSLANARRLHHWSPHLLAAARHALDNEDIPSAGAILPLATWWSDVARSGPLVDSLADRLLSHPEFDEHPRRADLLAARARRHLLVGDAKRALERAESALAHPAGLYTPSLAHASLSRALLFAADIPAATEHLHKAIETARGHPALADQARLELAIVTARTESHPAAIRVCRQIVQRAQGDDDVLIGTCASAFEAYLLLGIDPDAARATAELARPVADDVGDDYTCALLRMAAGVGAALSGDVAVGAGLVADSLRRHLDGGDLPAAQLCVLFAVVVLDRLGDPRAQRIAESARSMGDIHDQAFSPEEKELLAPAAAALEGTTTPVLGTPALLALTLEALDEHAATATLAPQLAGQAALRRQGDAWEVSFDAATVSLPMRKGLEDIARLLTTPDQDVHCLELMGAGTAVGDTGPAIDQQAIVAYRGRLQELEAVMEDSVGDTAAAKVEYDAILDELQRSLGLGGTARRGGSDAQKARSAVTWRIRSAIELVGQHHPSLGRHLDAAVRTGTWCAYRPERPVDWRVER